MNRKNENEEKKADFGYISYFVDIKHLIPSEHISSIRLLIAAIVKAQVSACDRYDTMQFDSIGLASGQPARHSARWILVGSIAWI